MRIFAFGDFFCLDIKETKNQVFESFYHKTTFTYAH